MIRLDRVLVIEHGRLIADDTPGNLSKNLSGDATVHVRAIGDEAAMQQTLAALQGVEEVTALGRKEDEAFEFRVKPEGKLDLRADIAKAMVEAGYAVIGLRFAELTLEDIFLDLIGKEEKKA